MNTREEMLSLIPKGGVGAEIGVFEGNFSEIILSVVTPCEFYMVDVFSGSMMSGDKNGENMKTINLDISYNNLVKKYSYNQSIKIVKGTSDLFFSTLPDHYLDFIYIDGDHGYSGVKKDLNNAIKKVKKGGFICGHDYHDSFKGVKDAVDEFCHQYDKQLFLTQVDKLPSFYFIA